MITIKIDTDNAAFELDGNYTAEVARILRELAARVEAGTNGYAISILDINGNKVGTMQGV
jgi:hypothetical protein